MGKRIPVLDGLRGIGASGVDLFFVLSGFLITGVILDVAGTRRVQWWYWLYLANLGPMRARPFSGPGHFWSLAIEEQFYLIWPFIIAHVSEQRLLKHCAVGVVAAFVSRTALAMAHVDPGWIEYMPFTRRDALLAGAATVIVHIEPVLALARRLPRIGGSHILGDLFFKHVRSATHRRRGGGQLEHL